MNRAQGKGYNQIDLLLDVNGINTESIEKLKKEAEEDVVAMGKRLRACSGVVSPTPSSHSSEEGDASSLKKTVKVEKTSKNVHWHDIEARDLPDAAATANLVEFVCYEASEHARWVPEGVAELKAMPSFNSWHPYLKDG